MTLCTRKHTHGYRDAMGKFFASLCTVSQAEVQLLYERFQKLGPDGDGRLNRSVFQKPPYSTDPFSRQVIYFLPAVLRTNTHNFVFDGMRIRGQ